MRCPALAALALLSSGCAPSSAGPRGGEAPPKSEPPIAVAAVETEPARPVPMPEPVTYGAWQGFGVAGCSYLAPDVLEPAMDVMFHFHAGQMATRDLKSSGMRGVFVACGYGIGSESYGKPFESPGAFGRMLSRLLATLGRSAGHPVELRRLGLASWSAGFAAVAKILGVPEWYEKTDSVVLNDSLHAGYTESGEVDVKMLRSFVRFATDARAGRKLMAITHSAIVPPGYASSAEATAALLSEAGWTGSSRDHAAEGGLTVSVDDGGLHVRGFRGTGPQDHFDHLHRIGETLRSWVVPRWYTPAQ